MLQSPPLVPSPHAHTPRCSSSAGAPVTPFEHNWVLGFRAGGYVCGASLIDEQWAITAAHCTQGTPAESMQVGVHRHALGWADNGEHDCAETVDIAEKYEHPEYNDWTLENDITLLRLLQVPPLPRALANRPAASRRLTSRSRASCRSRSAASTRSLCPCSTTGATAAPTRPSRWRGGGGSLKAARCPTCCTPSTSRCSPTPSANTATQATSSLTR